MDIKTTTSGLTQNQCAQNMFHNVINYILLFYIYVKLCLTQLLYTKVHIYLFLKQYQEDST